MKFEVVNSRQQFWLHAHTNRRCLLPNRQNRSSWHGRENALSRARLDKINYQRSDEVNTSPDFTSFKANSIVICTVLH